MLKKIQDTFKPGSMYKVFFATLLTTGLAYGIYKGILDNYLAEIVVMSEFDRGVAEFFRELPGLLIVFILALMYTCTAETMYKTGAVIMVAGIGMQTFVPADRIWVTIAICVYSLGEHIQLGMKNTMSLEYAEDDKGGVALGLQNSMSQVGTLAGYFVVMIAFKFVSGIKAFKGFFCHSFV